MDPSPDANCYCFNGLTNRLVRGRLAPAGRNDFYDELRDNF